MRGIGELDREPAVPKTESGEDWSENGTLDEFQEEEEEVWDEEPEETEVWDEPQKKGSKARGRGGLG